MPLPTRSWLVWTLSAWSPAAHAAARPAEVMRRVARSPFEVAPDKLLDAARRHADHLAQAGPVPDRLLLLDDTHWTLTADGRLAQSVHQVVYVHTEAAVPTMSGIGISWSPWLEDAPSLRARVIADDGTERWLKEDEVAVGSPRQGTGGLYTTDKTLEAPLPGVRAGVVVEQSYTRSPSRALSPTGTAFTWMAGRIEPVLLSRLVIDTPRDLELRSTLPDDAPAPREEALDGVHRTTWERVEVPAVRVPNVVSEDFSLPIWRFSAGGSWADLARSYGERVRAQQDPTGTEALVAMFSDVPDRRDRIAAALDAVRTQVRYTGLEFGESAVVPYKPAEALLRGYGDCKDQANLLVVALQAVGISARLALVDATGIDSARPEHPGLGVFDHVIVYLPDDDLWIDPTFPPAALGTLPLALGGRNALIVHPDTTALTQIPSSTSADNTYREVRTIQYVAGRPATFVEEMTGTGFLAHDLTMTHSGVPPRPTEGPLHAYVVGEYGTNTLTVEVEPSSARQPEFDLTLRGTADGRVAWDSGISVNPVYSTVFEPLPPLAFAEPSEAWRAAGVVEVPPFTSELVLRVTVPPGFLPRAVPPPATATIGDASLSWTTTWHAEERRLEGRLRFDTGDGRFTPDELDALRGWTLRGVDTFAEVELDDPGKALIARRRSIDAIDHYDALILADPTAAWPHSRKSQAYVALGLGEAALAASTRATELAPSNPYVWFDHGYAAMHDALGRQMGLDADLETSIAAFERVVELEGPTDTPLHNIAILMDRDRDGLGLPRSPDRTADAYERWVRQSEISPTPTTALNALLRAGRLDRVLELTADHPDEAAMTARLEAIARKSGVEAMLTEARRRSRTRELETERLVAAQAALMNAREYPLLSELVAARPDLVDDPLKAATLAEHFARVGRFEDTLDLEAHPEHALAALMVACIDQPDAVATSGVLLSGPTATDPSWQQFCQGTHGPVLASEVPLGVVFDTLLAMGTAEREGDDQLGYRLRWTLTDKAVVDGFVVREKRRWRLVALSASPHLVGQRVLMHHRKGDRAALQQWGDWLAALDVPGSRTTPPRTFGHHLTQLSEAGVDAATAAALVAAAAAPASPDGLRALDKLGPKAGATAPDATSELVETALGQLARSQALDRWKELATADWVRGLLSEDDRAALDRRVRMVTAPREALAALPPPAERTERDWRTASSLHQRVGEYPEALAALQTSSVEPEPNALAWAMILADADPESVIALLSERATSGRALGSAELHTLATALADADQPEAAWHTLQRALEPLPPRHVADLDLEWWYVIGRVAESYGELALARRYYARVPDTLVLHDVHVLCQRRLAELPPE